MLSSFRAHKLEIENCVFGFAVKNGLAVDLIDQCADTNALQSSPCVLSWPMLTTLMECIKLSTDDIDRIASVYRQRKRKKNTKMLFLIFSMTETHTCIMYTEHASVYIEPSAQVFLTQCYIIM